MERNRETEKDTHTERKRSLRAKFRNNGVKLVSKSFFEA